MKSLIGAAACALVIPCTIFSQSIRWQTTHQGYSTGNCRLKSNTVRVEVHPFHLSVQEEAVIAPTGSPWSGDPQTLEIFGNFRLSQGSAIRSMLLWNGDQILKAKLKDRVAADSAYEEVVDRNTTRPVVRDPALIEHMGSGQYQFKIYPVAVGGERKIRILYSVPLKARIESGTQFELRTAFTLGASEYPSSVTMQFVRSDSDSGRYVLKHGTNSRSVQFGPRYEIPHSDFTNSGNYWNPSPKALLIIPENPKRTRSYSVHKDSGGVAGYYTAVFASAPQVIIDASSQVYQNRTLEALIRTGESAYLVTLPSNGTHGTFGTYIKSQMPWDNTIHWTVYDSEGDVVIEKDQVITPEEESSSSDMLPLIWAAKYTLAEAAGDLGCLYGFVDNRMSLLALEEDSMEGQEALLWEDWGVPELAPEDMICDPSLLEPAPKEDIIFEIGTPAVADISMVKNLKIRVLSGGRISIALPAAGQGRIEIALVSLNGRVVQRWNKTDTASRILNVTAHEHLKGLFVLRVKAGAEMVQRKITLH